jgi:hypothetical protein
MACISSALNYFCHQIAWEFEQFTHHQLLPRQLPDSKIANLLQTRQARQRSEGHIFTMTHVLLFCIAEEAKPVSWIRVKHQAPGIANRTI